MSRSAFRILWTCASIACGACGASGAVGVVACSPDHPARSPAEPPRAEDEPRPGWADYAPANDRAPAGAELGSPAPLEAQGSGPALAIQRGQASYYGDSLAGHRTANGERYDPRAFTAAHKTLPFGTVVRVVRPDTGAFVVVRITDRGPFVSRRILDLSRAAAERLRMIRSGVVEVRAEIVHYGSNRKPSRRR